MTVALEVLLWVCLALLVYAQVGYGLLLALLARVRRPWANARHGARGAPEVIAGDDASLPAVSLIIAAHDEASVIEARVANALALDYPRSRLELIVSCDGCDDDTAERARAAGADRVLELPRGGKVAAQDAAVRESRGQLVAFSDANASWRQDALRRLVAAFAEPRVGYACGRLRFVPEDPAANRAARAPGGSPADRGAPARGGRLPNQEGVYWRYELALRGLESRLASITAGNGAIYAVRREAYVFVHAIMGHDLSLPFNVVQRGWRAVYVPDAVAVEKMVPTLEGEFARKRRMMSHTWPIVLRGGMLRLTSYPPLYALMIVSHRLLRYASPGLHLVALAANIVLAGRGALYVATLAAQLALLAAAGAARLLPLRPLLIARYYVLTTASPAAGLWDWLRRGTDPAWEAAEGTR